MMVSWKLAAVVLLPEIFQWFQAMATLSSTVHFIHLTSDKHHITVTTYNPIGFQKKPDKSRIRIADIRFLGLHRNDQLNLGDWGLFMSASRLWRGVRGASEEWRREARQFNKFRYFYKFSALNITYLVPIDHSEYHESVEDE